MTREPVSIPIATWAGETVAIESLAPVSPEEAAAVLEDAKTVAAEAASRLARRQEQERKPA